MQCELLGDLGLIFLFFQSRFFFLCIGTISMPLTPPTLRQFEREKIMNSCNLEP